jgi:hypothetical protein
VPLRAAVEGFASQNGQAGLPCPQGIFTGPQEELGTYDGESSQPYDPQIQAIAEHAPIDGREVEVTQRSAGRPLRPVEVGHSAGSGS